MKSSNHLSLLAPLLALSTAVGCGSTVQPPGGSGGASSGGSQSSSGGSLTAPSGGSPTNVGGSESSAGGAKGSGGQVFGSSGGTQPSSGGSQNSSGGSQPSSGGSQNSSGGFQGGGDEVLASQGCGTSPPTAGRTSIDVDDLTREYILALPEDYDNTKPYKLIFTWHPWGGSAQQVAGNGPNGYYGLLGVSKGQAIFVSPEGLDFGGNGLGWGNENGQDIAFLRAMMERFDGELCFDQNRVFSTGFSFGGMMSNAVACSGLARAVAPMAGNSMVSGCENGTKPVAYMGFHGTSDTVVDISGGQAARDVFVKRNGCGTVQASDSNWCELAGANFQPCECTTYEGCTAGYPVTWCEYKGSHMVAPSSSQTIWDFFAQF